MTAGVGALGYRYAPPTPGTHSGTVQELTTRLVASFTPTQRAMFMVDYDHPFRQYHNRGVWGGGELIATSGLSRDQLSLAVDLMYAGLSDRGRGVIPNQFFLSLPDIMVNNLLVCGDPGSGHCQVLFTGPHLNLRIGGRNREDVAFGGPQVYGDQRGNDKPGLPDNVYQPQMELGTQLYRTLSAQQQSQVVLDQSPIQTQIEVQGSDGVFPGLQIAALGAASEQTAGDLIESILSPYPADDVRYAWSCLDHNGGLGAMQLSYYADSRYTPDGDFQTLRLEGPGSVFYFRGFPHVHAFFNVAYHADQPLSVGKVVAHNDRPRQGTDLQALFERTLIAHTGADLAFYDLASVVGRLRAGPVRTGDLYNAESWQNKIAQVTVKGRHLNPNLHARIQGAVEPDREYRVATIDFLAEELMEAEIGDGDVTSADDGLLRDALIRYVSANGLS